MAKPAQAAGAAAQGNLAWVAVALALGLLLGAIIGATPPTLVTVPIGLIALVAIILFWSLPIIKSVPLRTTRLVFLCYLVAIACVPRYVAINFENLAGGAGLPWISAQRTLLLVMAPLAGICIFGSASVKDRLRRVFALNKPILVSLACLLTCFFLSVFTSIRPQYSLVRFVFVLVEWCLPFLVALVVIRRARDAQVVIRILIACLCLTVITAAAEHIVGQRIYVTYMPEWMLPHEAIFNYSWLPSDRNGLYRASANFLVPLSYGEFCAFVGALSYPMVFCRPGTADRVWGICGVVLAWTGMILAGARGTFVGAGLAVFVFAGLLAWRLMRNPTSKPWVLFLPWFIGLGGMAAVMGIATSGRGRRILFGGAQASASTQGRLAQIEAALPKIAHNPVTGHGLGTGAEVVGFWTGSYYTLDNYLLTLLVEAGIPGLLAFGAFLAAIAYAAWRMLQGRDRSRDFLAIGAITALASFSVQRLVLSQTENHALLFILAGMVAAAACWPATEEAEPPPARRAVNAASSPGSW